MTILGDPAGYSGAPLAKGPGVLMIKRLAVAIAVLAVTVSAAAALRGAPMLVIRKELR